MLLNCVAVQCKYFLSFWRNFFNFLLPIEYQRKISKHKVKAKNILERIDNPFLPVLLCFISLFTLIYLFLNSPPCVWGFSAFLYFSCALSVFDHSLKKRKDSLETRVVLIEISMLCWDIPSGPKKTWLFLTGISYLQAILMSLRMK